MGSSRLADRAGAAALARQAPTTLTGGSPPLPTGQEDAQTLLRLVAKSVMGAGAIETDDIRTAYEELKGKGVTFLQEPVERPYGIEALFRDDSGNWFSLNQR